MSVWSDQGGGTLLDTILTSHRPFDFPPVDAGEKTRSTGHPDVLLSALILAGAAGLAVAAWQMIKNTQAHTKNPERKR